VPIFALDIRQNIKEMKLNPVIIIILLFILGGFLYGPAQKKQNTNSTSKSSSSIGEKPNNKDVSENIQKTREEIQKIEKEVKKKEEESKRSPYYKKVSMSGVSGVNNPDPNKEYITLYTNIPKGEKIKITGWYLKSETTGNWMSIGKASLLPFPFTKTESDVVLQAGDRVTVTKGFSPIGISFRTNICTGYFEENREFSPSLYQQCPRPTDENLPKFSTDLDRNDECLDLIERIPVCTTKDSSFTRTLPDTVTQSCKTYITTQINYNSCVSKHLGDTDFPGNEYRIYLNRFGPLWRAKREIIHLYDQDDLVVSTISY